jgi:hypothetical protein
MVRVQRSNLARVIPSLVGVLLIHVVWDSDLREDTWSQSHVVHALLSYAFELVSEAVTYGGFSNLDCERWRVIFPP